MRILITGTREPLTPAMEREIYNVLREACAGYADGEITIVHGACPTGVDAYVDRLMSGSLAVERHPAKWRELGRAAGPARNAVMVRKGADLCLAFPHGASRGTRGCAELAMRAGIPTKVVEL